MDCRRVRRCRSGLLFILAICLSAAGSIDSAGARPARLYPTYPGPDCGRILDDCVPVCNWSVPGGGWPLVACYNTVCYRQAGACAASQIPRPAGERARMHATGSDK